MKKLFELMNRILSSKKENEINQICQSACGDMKHYCEKEMDIKSEASRY